MVPTFVAPLVLFATPAVMWWLERKCPLQRRENPSAHYKHNARIAIPVLLVGTASGIATATTAIYVGGSMNVLAGLVLFELGDWLRHFAMHRVPILWRIHARHHDDESLDFSTAFRNHPLENVIHGVWHSAWVALLGIPLLSLLIRTPLLFGALYFQHANIHVPRRVEAILQWLTPTPRQHREHHARDLQRGESNYGVLLTFWDRIFGTWRKPGPDLPSTGTSPIK